MHMKKLNRTQLTFIAGAALILSGVISLINFPGKQYVSPFLDQATSALLEQFGGVETPDTVAVSDTAFYPVQKIVDGDTIDVTIQGNTERVRLIGIDAPESVTPEQPVECYGPEASVRTGILLQGTQVRLEADPSQDNKDSYGRLLRYVFLEDGTLINERLIEEGYAREYTFATAYRYQTLFTAAEARARASNLGLWGTACAGR